MLSGARGDAIHSQTASAAALRGLNPNEAGDLHLLAQRGEIACVNGLNNSRNKNGNQEPQNGIATRRDEK